MAPTFNAGQERSCSWVTAGALMPMKSRGRAPHPVQGPLGGLGDGAWCDDWKMIGWEGGTGSSIPFHSFHSIPFHSIPFDPFQSIPSIRSIRTDLWNPGRLTHNPWAFRSSLERIPLRRPRFHRWDGQGEGTARPASAVRMRCISSVGTVPRPGSPKTWSRHRGNYRFEDCWTRRRAAHTRAHAHAHMTISRCTGCRDSRTTIQPGDDAVTVAITARTQRGAAGGNPIFTDAGKPRALCASHWRHRDLPHAVHDAEQRDAGRDQIDKPAGTTAGGLLTLAQREDGLITRDSASPLGPGWSAAAR